MIEKSVDFCKTKIRNKLSIIEIRNKIFFLILGRCSVGVVGSKNAQNNVRINRATNLVERFVDDLPMDKVTDLDQ